MKKLFMVVLGFMLVGGSVSADDCGCVGSTQTFGWGDTITESCTLNCELVSDGTCFTVGTDNITIDGAGYSITERDTVGGGYHGINVSGRSNITIQNIEIYQFAYGIYVENSDDIEINNSVISDNYWWHGIYFLDTDNSVISGNTLEGNGLRTGGEAIIFNNSSDNIISGNTINNNGIGIKIYKSNNNTVTDNTVTNSYLDGIKIYGSSNGNVLNLNTFCSNGWSTNTDYDIRDESGFSNTGDNNFCDTTYNYNDTGTTGCTYACISPTPVASPTPKTAGWINDYNGDGTSDIAVFRASSGLWAIRNISRVYFGGSSDQPEPSDYDGNGTTDIGIFRESSGLWAIRDVTRAYFGGGYDQPQPGDYDGDGTADIGIFRTSSGLWAIRAVTRAYFGGTGDQPQPGYYSGDGTADIGIFRSSSGLWAIRGVTRAYFGSASDEPVPGDYGGDETFAPAIFRPSSGLWAIRGVTRVYFGSSTDQPVPANYLGDGIDDIGIFRPSSGLWAARDITRVYFGGSSDIPVTR